MEYWRCKTGSIFCNGVYNPASGMCSRCVKKSKATGERRGIRDVFRIFRKQKQGRRPTGGGVFFVSYNPQLFQNKKSSIYSYSRVLYERVTKTRCNNRIVVWGGRGLPEFEELIVLPHGVSPHEAPFTEFLYQIRG